VKLLYFNDFRLGVLAGQNVVDVTGLVQDIPHTGPGDLMNGLIERWDAYKGKLEAAAAKGGGVPVSSVRIRPPLPRPVNMDCMAVNYMENGTLPAPAPINGFHKSPSGIIGDGDTMVLPDVPATIFEGEAELGMVIGKRATNVGQADAMSYVFGYINFIDGSARGLTPGFFLMKSRETFAPMGPYLVTADEVRDPQNLSVKLWNNGQLMQDFNTNDMAHKLPRCIEWLSQLHTLEPGDVIATGTNHRGLNPFLDGDKIELEVEGLGRLHINVKDDLKRTWKRETRLMRQEQGHKDPTPQVSGKYAK
jgi:2-keto-4-pentenoate hydratase/2-oxohepta-3-ene-1,7-dioic acid hydratase in catechol pathway